MNGNLDKKNGFLYAKAAVALMNICKFPYIAFFCIFIIICC